MLFITSCLFPAFFICVVSVPEQMDKAGIGGGDGAGAAGKGKKSGNPSESDAFENYRRNKSYSFRRF